MDSSRNKSLNQFLKAYRKYKSGKLSDSEFNEFLENNHRELSSSRSRYESIEDMTRDSRDLCYVYGDQAFSERFPLRSYFLDLVDLGYSREELSRLLSEIKSEEESEHFLSRQYLDFLSYDRQSFCKDHRTSNRKKSYRSQRNGYYYEKQNFDIEYIQMVRRSSLKKKIREALGIDQDVPGARGSRKRLPVYGQTSKRKSLGRRSLKLNIFI